MLRWAIVIALIVAAGATAAVVLWPRASHWTSDDAACLDRDLVYGVPPYYPGMYEVIRPPLRLDVLAVTTDEDGVRQVFLAHPDGYQPLRFSERSLDELAHRC